MEDLFRLARTEIDRGRLVNLTMGDMAEFRESMALLVSGAIEPVVDGVHAPAAAADAYGRLESGEQFGKVVIRWTG